MVANDLENEDSVDLNGVILLSQILNFDLSIDGYGYVGLNNDHMWRYQPTPGLVSSVAQTYYCAGTQIVFTGQVLGDFFGPDNVFSIQLSDASGDFAAPQTIATCGQNSPGSSVNADLLGLSLRMFLASEALRQTGQWPA